jgi:hypothetical protein
MTTRLQNWFTKVFQNKKTEPTGSWHCFANLCESDNYKLQEEYYYYDSIAASIQSKNSNCLTIIRDEKENSYIVKEGFYPQIDADSYALLQNLTSRLHSVFHKESEGTKEQMKEVSPFLTIKYIPPNKKVISTHTCNNMQDIYLDIPREYFYTGNELLSATFVKRWLDYHVGKVDFDNSYRIEMMDSNFEFVNLGFHDYIVVKENGYEVVKKERDSQ